DQHDTGAQPAPGQTHPPNLRQPAPASQHHTGGNQPHRQSIPLGHKQYRKSRNQPQQGLTRNGFFRRLFPATEQAKRQGKIHTALPPRAARSSFLRVPKTLASSSRGFSSPQIASVRRQRSTCTLPASGSITSPGRFRPKRAPFAALSCTSQAR